MSESILSALAAIEDILQQLPDYAAKKQAIIARLQQNRLRVLVYGAYNTGKSTLINALLGLEQAATGEVPTTNRIQAYDWQDIQLLDSPGIHAPIEHEQISKAEIIASDLILFVIRQDDEDSAAIYQELMQFLKQNKPVFIIYNYSGLNPRSSGEGSVYHALHHLNQILLREAQQAGISDEQLKQVEMVAVNLRTALKARLQSQLPLLEYSGFSDLEQRLQQWLAHYPTAQLRLHNIKQQIEQTLLEPAKALFTDSLSQELQTLYQQLSWLKLQRQNLLTELHLILRSEVEGLSQAIVLCLQQGQQPQAEAEIQAAYQRIETAVQQKLQQNWSALKEKFDLSISQPEYRDEEENFQISKYLPDVLTLPLPNPYRWLGPVIAALKMLFSSDDKATQRENEMRRQQALQIAQIAQQVRSGIMASLWPQIEQAVQANYQPQLQVLENQITAQQAHLQAQQAQLARLEQAKQQIMVA